MNQSNFNSYYVYTYILKVTNIILKRFAKRKKKNLTKSNLNLVIRVCSTGCEYKYSSIKSLLQVHRYFCCVFLYFYYCLLRNKELYIFLITFIKLQNVYSRI